MFFMVAVPLCCRCRTTSTCLSLAAWIVFDKNTLRELDGNPVTQQKRYENPMKTPYISSACVALLTVFLIIVKVSSNCRVCAVMKRHALAGGGSLLGLGIVWSQAICAKVSVFLCVSRSLVACFRYYILVEIIDHHLCCPSEATHCCCCFKQHVVPRVFTCLRRINI